jgi:hypothetical protein
MSDFPSVYTKNNAFQTKFLNVVVEFEGTDIKFSLVPTYKKIRYGDPGLNYGDPGIVYGGLRRLDGVYAYLSPNSNLSLSQKLEPEQGRASAGTLSLEFIDFNGFMTNFVTSGKVFDELLGSKMVKVWVGYQNSSFREDYFVVFRGYVTGVQLAPTKCIMQITDANIKRKQQCFYTGKTQVRAIQKNFIPGNVGLNTITISNHGLQDGMIVNFFSTSALPEPLDSTRDYYVYARTTNTFEVSSTSINSVSNNFLPSNVGSNTISIINHGYVDGTKITFTTTGTLPTGLLLLTDYYVISSSRNSFKVSSSDNGTEITFGGGGTGQHTVTSKPNIIQFSTTGSGTHTVLMKEVGSQSQVIPIEKNDGLTQAIIGPNGLYDSSVQTFIKIGDEYMQYSPAGIGVDTITVTRAQLESLAVSHAVADEISNPVQLEGNILDLSLKIMLSGTTGPWIENVVVSSFGTSNSIVLPDGVDAVEDYGLARGDYVYVTGSVSNNSTFTVKTFGDSGGYPNKVIFFNETIVPEFPTSGVFSIRSQYDTLPDNLGNGLRPIDIDVERWQYIQTLFVSRPENVFRILIEEPMSPKELIEKEFLLPNSLYSATRFGRISCAATRPPLAGNTLVVLDSSNVKDPQTTTVQRSLNTRRFFNEVQYQFDYDTSGKSTNVTKILDSSSLSKTTVSSVLPIQAKGMRSDLGAQTLVDKRGGYLLRRYKDAAFEISLKTNWEAASLIQVTDTVAVYDNGGLQIANLNTGERDLGNQLFEVIEWSLDIKSGSSQLKLLSSPGYQVTDRFGGIAPSSQLDVGSTTSQVILKDSFGALYPGAEWKKWEPILGDSVVIRSSDYSIQYITTIISFDPIDPNKVVVNPALPLAPPANYVMELDQYAEPNPAVNQKSKLLFQYIDPTLTVTSGVSTTQFNVSSGDALKVVPGLPVSIHNADFSIQSSEATVDTVVGTLVTLKTAIEFIPSAGQLVELVGFLDNLGAYRIL